MKKKLLYAMCFSTLLVSGVYSNTYANVGESPKSYSKELVANSADVDAMLYWVNVSSMSATLAINNGRAEIAGLVLGNLGTESITVNAVLERANPNGTFTHINSWNDLRVNDRIWAWSTAHYVARGHDYRLTLTATAVRNGVSEVVSVNRTTRAN